MPIKNIAWVAAITSLLALDAIADSPRRPTDLIMSFEIRGINAQMDPERARAVLLETGFTEKGGGDSWGKVPTATFTKDNLMVSISHFEGEITGLSEFRTFTGDLFDYSQDLARIRAHFDIAANDPACVEKDYGARCGFSDGDPKGARFIASLTEQMISVQLGKSR